jgi:hypothetical protein
MFCTLPAIARVGETYAEFLKRPGINKLRVIEKTKRLKVADHKRGSFGIRVEVLDGVIISEAYKPISWEESRALLSAYPGQVIEEEAGRIRVWKTEKIFATYNGNMLLILTGDQEVLRRSQEEAEMAKKAEAKKKVDGL